MPELPEVETTVRYLRRRLVGLRFKGVWSDWEKTLKQAGGATNLKKEIRNKKIIDVYRRAKFIVINIEGNKSLFIHQKISGHLLYGVWNFENGVWKALKSGALKNDPENKYIRVVFSLNNGRQLALADLRRFAKIILVKDKDISNLKEIRDLGPEPLEISFNEFARLFKHKKGRIKPVIMDPFFIVGIGNIYADEILWRAGIHPLSRVENILEEDLKNIYRWMKIILFKAIEMGGSSVDDYRMPSGKKGSYQNLHRAYQRTGKKCAKNDGGVIKRLKIRGRSAHFCNEHQKLV